MRIAGSPPNSRPLPARLPFYYGWVMVFIAGLAMAASGPGQTYGVSAFIDPIIADLGWSRTLVSTLYTFGSLTAAGAIIFIGRAVDRFGARKSLAAATLAMAGAAVWMSQVHSPFGLYLGFAALRVLGQGALTLIATTMVAVWFVGQRGKVMAVAALGGAVSLAGLPPLTLWLISVYEWRGAWIALAVILLLVLLVPGLLLVRRSPEDIGLRPYGVRPARRPNPDESGAQARADEEGDEDSWTLSEALRTKAMWLLLFAGSAFSLIGTGLMFHQVSVLGELGFSPGVATSVFAVIAPAQFVGMFAAGVLNDRFPNRYMIVLSQGVLALAMGSLFLITSAWQVYFYGALLGVGAGVSMNTSNVIFANYYGRGHFGSIRGVASFGMMGSSALGPLPLGAVFDAAGSYNPGIIALLALLPFTIGAALLAVPPERKTAAA